MRIVNRQDSSGRLVYSADIVRDIVNCAMTEVEGLVKYPDNSKQARDSIKVEIINEDLYIDVYVKMMFNVEVSDVASNLQNTIKNTIESMTEFTVKFVNVHVIDVEFLDN